MNSAFSFFNVMKDALDCEREASVMSKAFSPKTEENIESVFFSMFPFTFCSGEKR